MERKPNLFWTTFAQILKAVNRGIDSVLCDVQPQWYNDPPLGDPVRFELTEDGLLELLFGMKGSEWWISSKKLRPAGRLLQFAQEEPTCIFREEENANSYEVKKRYTLTERDGTEVQTREREAFFALNKHVDEIDESVFIELKKLFKTKVDADIPETVTSGKQIIAFLLALEQEKPPEIRSMAAFYDKTHFVGREEEVRRVMEFLRNSRKETLVLSGPGMVGKSFLLEQIIREVEELSDNWQVMENGMPVKKTSLWHLIIETFGEQMTRRGMMKHHPVCRCAEGNNDDLDALLAEIARIHQEGPCKLVITTRLEVEETEDIEVLRLQPLSDEALEKLFRSYIPKKAEGKIADETVRKLVASVSGNALLMWLIGDACFRYFNKEADDKIRCLTDMVIEQQHFYQREDLKACLDILGKPKYRTAISEGGHVLQQMKSVFGKYFPEEDKIILHMLSFLTGMAIPRAYMERWFNLSRGKDKPPKKSFVEPLIRLGWFREINENNVLILIPRIVAINMIMKGEENESYEELKYYVDAFCWQLIDEALCPENEALQEKIIFRLHDYFLASLNKFKANSARTKNVEELKKEENAKDICKKLSYQFHLASILFFLWQKKPQQAQKLLMFKEDLPVNQCSDVTKAICESWISLVSVKDWISCFNFFSKYAYTENNVLKQVKRNLQEFTPEELELISEYLVFFVESWVNNWKRWGHTNGLNEALFSLHFIRVIRDYISLYNWLLEIRLDPYTDITNRVADMRGLENVVYFAEIYGSHIATNAGYSLLDRTALAMACAVCHDLKQQIQNQYRRLFTMMQTWMRTQDRRGAESLRRSIDDFLTMCEFYGAEINNLDIEDSGYTLITYYCGERLKLNTLLEAINHCENVLEIVNARLAPTAQTAGQAETANSGDEIPAET